MVITPTQKIEKNIPKYEKPYFKEKKALDFPEEIWEKFNGGKFCIQCSG